MIGCVEKHNIEVTEKLHNHKFVAVEDYLQSYRGSVLYKVANYFGDNIG